MQDFLSSEELDQLHRLTMGGMARVTVDEEVMERLAEEGLVRPVLGGWVLTDQGSLVGARRR